MSKNIWQKIERGEVSICQTCIHRLVCRAVDNQPCTECNHHQNVADVAPVRHGRWIELSRTSKCSECGFETGRYEPPRRYCPECGAKMDWKEDGHEAG